MGGFCSFSADNDNDNSDNNNNKISLPLPLPTIYQTFSVPQSKIVVYEPPPSYNQAIILSPNPNPVPSNIPVPISSVPTIPIVFAEEKKIQNRMNRDQWTVACFKLIENDLWEEAKDIIDNQQLNVELLIHMNNSGSTDLPTLICDKSRIFRKDSLQYSLCLEIIKICGVKLLNDKWPSSLDNLLMKEIVKFSHLKCCNNRRCSCVVTSPNHNLGLEAIHYLIVGGTDLNHKNRAGNDALSLAIKTKNSGLIKLLLYHLNFNGTKEQQMIFPSDIF